MKRKLPSLRLSAITQNKSILLIAVLFFATLFFRFYGFETRHAFGWDQLDNAWAAKNIIVDNTYPLVGMVAKGNSGFYIGPLYYYYVAFFYWMFSLDPVASVFIAGFTSVITFIVYYFIIKHLFSKEVALISLFVYTFSSFAILADRVQWPVNFIPIVSLLIFFSLYRVITGHVKYIFFLVASLGLSLHIHFTAIFFFLITFLSLPFFPRTKKAVMLGLLSVPLLLGFFLPNILYDLQSDQSTSGNLQFYIEQYYHGLHGQRVLQLAKDAFIEFAAFFDIPFIKELRYFLLPVFLLFFLRKDRSRSSIVLSYLLTLWFVVPWIVFATYRGEISNYYFSLTRPMTLFMVGYILVFLIKQRNIVLSSFCIAVLFAYAIWNISLFLKPYHLSLADHRRVAEERVERGEVIEFNQGDPASYFYFLHRER